MNTHLAHFGTLELPAQREALADTLRLAVETGRAEQLRLEWEVDPAGNFRFCFSLEEGAHS
jgi:hypothetical protein